MSGLRDNAFLFGGDDILSALKVLKKMYKMDVLLSRLLQSRAAKKLGLYIFCN